MITCSDMEMDESHYITCRTGEPKALKVGKASTPAPKAEREWRPMHKAAKESSPIHKAAKEPSPAHKAAIEPSPAHKAVKGSSPAHKATKEPTPAQHPARKQPAISRQPVLPSSSADHTAPMRGDKKIRSRSSKARGKPSKLLDLDERTLIDLSTQEVVLHDWSTYLHTPPSPEGEILDEISRHFAMVTKEPSRRRASHLQGPKLKRLSAETGGMAEGPASRRRRGGEWRMPVLPSKEGLVPPLHRSSGVRQHDGKVISQILEDTTGVKLQEPELHLVQNRTRVSLKSLIESLPPSTPVSHHTLDTSTGAQPVIGACSSPPSSPEHPPNQSGVSAETGKLRQSLLLESREEGDLETR